MNYSKKHCKHNRYALNRDEPIFYNFARGKKNRKRLKKLFKDIHRGVWQKRIYEQTGIKLNGLVEEDMFCNDNINGGINNGNQD